MSEGRPSDDALWASVDHTLRHVVLPALDDPHARLAAIQLVGLAGYARGRGVDPAGARVAELAARLDGLAGNELVAAHWPAAGRDRAGVMAACAAALTAAVGRTDAAAEEVRSVLRPRLVAHLDDDLAATSGLLGPFRGKLPDG